MINKLVEKIQKTNAPIVEMCIRDRSELQPDGTEKTTDKTEDVQETEAPEDAENTDDVENAQQELSYEAVASVEGQENPVCDFGTIRAESCLLYTSRCV